MYIIHTEIPQKQTNKQTYHLGPDGKRNDHDQRPEARSRTETHVGTFVRTFDRVEHDAYVDGITTRCGYCGLSCVYCGGQCAVLWIANW